ncbi:MAG: tRNA (cytidine(34)-2'-O)-methyltransferase [Candidatus Sumerlaeia bacterium]|nr:tRNA (cytidine(34)-2'-O)-methyltransferase [Candidatus Sumerlaeia bacterium]
MGEVVDGESAMFNIVLVHPQIPPNTGQIARLCAATGAVLHLVRPLGFRLDDRSLRRAGLDYWSHVEVRVHASLDAFWKNAGDARFWFYSKTGLIRYDRVCYQMGDWLVFGSETEGLPLGLLERERARTVFLPMRRDAVRSLNLASCVSVALYEALRQTGYPTVSGSLLD